MKNTPTEGTFPTISYTYVAADDARLNAHEIVCSCGAWCRTSEPKMAQHFVRVHTGEHASRRIINPPAPEEP